MPAFGFTVHDGTKYEDISNLNKTLNWLLVNLDHENIPMLAKGGSLGFFGGTSSTELSVTSLSTTATLGQTINKLNELLTALQSYNLV